MRIEGPPSVSVVTSASEHTSHRPYREQYELIEDLEASLPHYCPLWRGANTAQGGTRACPRGGDAVDAAGGGGGGGGREGEEEKGKDVSVLFLYKTLFFSY